MSINEAIDITRRAMTLWKNAGENPSEQAYYDFVSLMQIAIEKAGEPTAFLHSILAQVHFDMNNFPASWEEADKTLAIDIDDFAAQHIKTIITYSLYADSLEVAQNKSMGFWDTLSTIGNIRNGYRQGQESGRKIGESIGSKRQANRAKDMLYEEVRNLVELYKRICTQGIAAAEFINYSRILLKLGDGLSETDLNFKESMNFYLLVANIPIDQITFNSDEERDNVQTMQLIAQGRLTL